MLLKKMKLIGLVAVLSSLFALPMLANADDLNISNNSKHDLSFSINHVCSDEFGVANQHTINNVIPEKSFYKVCDYSPEKCAVTVYNAAACMGKQVATIIFNTTNGVQGVRPMGVTIKASGFHLSFEEPSMT